MFKFKVKIQNEHSLKTRDNSEHRLSIKAMMATIIIYVGGSIKYSSKTVINKALVTARALIPNTSYKSKTTLLGKVFVRLVGENSLYKSSTKALERFLVKAKSELKMSFKNSLLEKILVRLIGVDTNYHSKTLISKAVILARTFLTNSYRSSTALLGKVMVRLRADTLYKSSFEIMERFLVGLKTNPITMSLKTSLLEKVLVRFRTKEIVYSISTFVDRAVILAQTFLTNSYRSSTTLLGKVFVRLVGENSLYKSSFEIAERFLVGVKTSLINMSHKTSILDKVLARFRTEGVKYIGKSSTVSTKMLTRGRSVLDYSFKTVCSMCAYIREFASFGFVSNSSLLAKSFLRALSSTVFRFTTSIKEAFLSRATSKETNYSSSSNITKEGLNTRLIIDSLKYIGSSVASGVNKVCAKIKGENNISSKTDITENKMYEYYTVKLNTYEEKKLNEVNTSLLRLCYIIDKNWISVKKIYKLWSGVKERVSSWGDLK